MARSGVGRTKRRKRRQTVRRGGEVLRQCAAGAARTRHVTGRVRRLSRPEAPLAPAPERRRDTAPFLIGGIASLAMAEAGGARTRRQRRGSGLRPPRLSTERIPPPPPPPGESDFFACSVIRGIVSTRTHETIRGENSNGGCQIFGGTGLRRGARVGRLQQLQNRYDRRRPGGACGREGEGRRRRGRAGRCRGHAERTSRLSGERPGGAEGGGFGRQRARGGQQGADGRRGGPGEGSEWIDGAARQPRQDGGRRCCDGGQRCGGGGQVCPGADIVVGRDSFLRQHAHDAGPGAGGAGRRADEDNGGAGRRRPHGRAPNRAVAGPGHAFDRPERPGAGAARRAGGSRGRRGGATGQGRWRGRGCRRREKTGR